MSLQEQLELRIEREISNQMDTILEKVNRIAKKFSIDNKDEKSPFKNVLAVATDSSSSLEVIKNYIRYQIGRKDSSLIWKSLVEEDMFAIALVKELNKLNEDVTKILQKLRKNIPKNNPLESYLTDTQNRERIERNIHLKIAQLYLGYLAREHTAMVGEKKEREKREKKREKTKV
ncbi:hypothetical protein [Microcoleus sp. bin38.metabat.b11b12b14.051]|uniref:hypothetical protein n=1 Tax=Microcoleus sp. bin38.metabat.b11b12b14.051 TaxID=2742709 RepID=UPI0025EB2175|nr:hypothetical protein [Microcoleus sp. bin38.metabat.b11b12b14.051]